MATSNCGQSECSNIVYTPTRESSLLADDKRDSLESFCRLERCQFRERKMSQYHQECHMHPSFKTKPVYELSCRYCDHIVCVRGMRAILLADKSVELYSTDQPPPGMLLLVGPDYRTNNCQCKIQDTACCGCGCMVGYHVTLPCQSCLRSCNNGHFWMFHSNSVHATERLDSTGREIMVWATVPPSEDDEKMTPYQLPLVIECCR